MTFSKFGKLGIENEKGPFYLSSPKWVLPKIGSPHLAKRKQTNIKFLFCSRIKKIKKWVRWRSTGSSASNTRRWTGSARRSRGTARTARGYSAHRGAPHRKKAISSSRRSARDQASRNRYVGYRARRVQFPPHTNRFSAFGVRAAPKSLVRPLKAPSEKNAPQFFL